MLSRVSSLYEAAPFPDVSRLTRQAHPDFCRGLLGNLLGRAGKDAFAPDLRIWVAGCGTIQAVQAAMDFPRATILATDITAASLDVARSLARRLRLRNIEFRREDILAAKHRSAFDLIQCTGVLHHLSDPLAGLRKLHAALKPTGCVELFLYSRLHRLPFVRFQAVHRALDGLDGPFEARRAAAEALLGFLASEPGLDPEWLAKIGRFRAPKLARTSAFADTLMHPQEVSYDLDEARAFLREGGFRFASWKFPFLWEPASCVANPALKQRVAALPDEDRWTVTQALLGAQTPYLHFYAEREDRPAARPPLSDALLSARPIFGRRIVYPVRAGRVGKPVMERAFRREGEDLVFETGSTRLRWSLPIEARGLIEACDGQRTVEELVQRFGRRFAREDVLDLFGTVLPPRTALFAALGPMR